jgi:hypothetical protein
MGWSFVEHSNVTCLGFFLGYGEDWVPKYLGVLGSSWENWKDQL